MKNYKEKMGKEHRASNCLLFIISTDLKSLMYVLYVFVYIMHKLIVLLINRLFDSLIKVD